MITLRCDIVLVLGNWQLAVCHDEEYYCSNPAGQKGAIDSAWAAISDFPLYTKRQHFRAVSIWDSKLCLDGSNM